MLGLFAVLYYLTVAIIRTSQKAVPVMQWLFVPAVLFSTGVVAIGVNVSKKITAGANA